MKLVDPDEMWCIFQAHLNDCELCTSQGECPEGARLRDVWGSAESKWARLQADILAAAEFPDLQGEI